MRRLLVLILAQAVCIFSFSVSSRSKRRIKNLEKCVLMFDQIETDILFSADNIYGLIMKISDENSPGFLNEFLQQPKSVPLETRWSKSLEKLKHHDCFKSEDLRILKSFGKQLGVTDADGQVKNCAAHKKLLQNNLSTALRENEKRGNLYTTLGLLSSIGIIVLLI